MMFFSCGFSFGQSNYMAYAVNMENIQNLFKAEKYEAANDPIGDCRGAPSKDKVHVLFIGNSLTFINDMPQILQKMLDEDSANIRIHQSTFGGMSLSGHLSDVIISRSTDEIFTRKKLPGEHTESEIKLEERKWDFIILQTGTVGILIPEYRDLKVSIAVADFKKRSKNLNCKFFLFKTWPTKEAYPRNYCYPKSFIDNSLDKDRYCAPLIENLDDEMKLIDNGYDLVAAKNEISTSANGEKFYDVMKNYPDLELLEDESHPNKYGAFLNACIFYQIITVKKATELAFNGNIDIKTAKLLKMIAE
jgi:hypothetical protein